MVQIEKQAWGKVNGKTVHLFHIKNDSGMALSVSDYGCILQRWLKDGRDLVLGYDSLQEYLESETFFGAAVGPVADRLAGGKCEICGQSVQFPLNAGPDCMHSGANGFHSRIWSGEILENGVAFSYAYSEEENPLPGRLSATIRYLLKESGFRIEYEACCDRETLLSLTNHSYFTLHGGKTDCKKDLLRVNADFYAETTRESDPICTGRLLPVENTPLDFRTARPVGEALAQTGFSEICRAGGVDHYFPVSGSGMREHARLQSGDTTLVCASDAPGVLIYTANGLEAEKGKSGQIYGRNFAVCMETECFPNAANFSEHRHQVYRPAGRAFTTCTEYQIIFS